MLGVVQESCPDTDLFCRGSTLRRSAHGESSKRSKSSTRRSPGRGGRSRKTFDETQQLDESLVAGLFEEDASALSAGKEKKFQASIRKSTSSIALDEDDSRNKSTRRRSQSLSRRQAEKDEEVPRRSSRDSGGSLSGTVSQNGSTRVSDSPKVRPKGSPSCSGSSAEPKLKAPTTVTTADDATNLEILQLEYQLKAAQREKKQLVQDHANEILTKTAEIAILKEEIIELKRNSKLEATKKENVKLLKQCLAWKDEHDKLALQKKLLLEANEDLTKKHSALVDQMDRRDSSAAELLKELEELRKEAVRSRQLLDATLAKQKEKMEILDLENDANKRRVTELEAKLLA